MPNRIITTSNSSFSLVTMSAGFLNQAQASQHTKQRTQEAQRTSPSMSDKLAVGSDGALLPVNSVKWRQAHCTGSPLATQPGPWKACLELFQ